MYRKEILASLDEVATSLENSGYIKEAEQITDVMVKMAQAPNLLTSVPRGGFLNTNQSQPNLQQSVNQWVSTNQTAINNATKMADLSQLIMQVPDPVLRNEIVKQVGAMLNARKMQSTR